MLSAMDRLPEVAALVRKRQYFVVLAPRRCGKTTAFLSFASGVGKCRPLQVQRSAFDDAAVNGLGYGLRSTGDAELVERVFEMVFERVDAHAGELGDLVVAVAF